MTIPDSIGPYTIVEKLGQGGMGVVYKARDKRLRRLVALKFLLEGSEDSRVTRRFLREAQAASALNHPHIVAIYDIGEENGTAYIVMEYVEGKSLKQLIPAEGLPMTIALACATQIAQAVAAAHGAGIVHRDLKPANVIVGGHWHSKVLDFGLARFDSEPTAPAEDGDAFESMTQPGVFMGTAAYVSPEQSTGGKVDHRSDIFSFGIMLQEMLTGRRPFAGNSAIELVYAVNKSEPFKIRELCPDLPEELERAVLRMLAKHPNDRFQTMDNVAAALEALKGGSSGGVRAAAGGGASDEATRWADPVAAQITPEAASHPSGRSKLSGPPPPGSENAAIAVLPFRSLSQDKDDEYLAAGITSELVRALSGVPGVRVASELTSFKFRNDVPDIENIAASLKLRYVLSGSLRRAGNRIRVIAELSEAPHGIMIWSETYNRGIEDVFGVQEEIAQAIVSATGGQIIKARGEHAVREPVDSLDAWGLVNKANYFVNHAYHFEAIDEAIDLLRKAISIAPGYAAAYGFLGLYLIQRLINSRSTDVARDRAEALGAVDHALRLAPKDPEVLENSGLVYFNCGKTEQAKRALRRAVDSAPFNLVAWGYLGLCLGWAGNDAAVAEAGRILDRLIANTPDHPSLPYWLYFKAGVCAREGRFEEAADCACKSAELQPRFSLALLEYANALGSLGRQEEALDAMREVLAVNPGATQAMYIAELTITTGSADRVRPHIEGLIAAGIFTQG
ncbi:MAG TPA: protein kinase [Bryobacteraceae bacterium]|nr:protein kinase [Bryobacteraceae bacterium]